MEETLKQILSELQKTNQRMVGFEKRMDGVEKHIIGFEKRMIGFEQHMVGFEKRMDGFEQRMIGFEQRFDNLDKDMKELKVGQEQLKDNTINRVGSYIEEIAKHVDVRFDEVKDTLDDQQRVIDTLAIRSVKNESEIKEFKRIRQLPTTYRPFGLIEVGA
ncbi:hypothetical protein [Lentibacillus sp. Marseille-P4043]|uniref:hypothetical protein n=1 Tax=Lentibacillus sp. Marseille-P4043 TaxID=2040293 RepID=UPI000D0B40E9|nr:hypothetical protein [Lentibacillus sp. Marseille-P4043]